MDGACSPVWVSLAGKVCETADAGRISEDVRIALRRNLNTLAQNAIVLEGIEEREMNIWEEVVALLYQVSRLTVWNYV